MKAFDLKMAELLECCANIRAREDEKGSKRAEAKNAEEEKADIEPAAGDTKYAEAAYFRAGALLARK